MFENREFFLDETDSGKGKDTMFAFMYFLKI